MTALTHFPKTRLSELIGRLGGVTRSDAIEKAKKELESMRGKSDEVIAATMDLLDLVINKPANHTSYSDGQMIEILALGDQIITLAGTFGYDALDKAVRSLCDVTDGLLRTKRVDVASIKVHMGTIRMVAPGGPSLTPEQIGVVLSELSKILVHHGFDKLSEAAGDIEEPGSARAAG